MVWIAFIVICCCCCCCQVIKWMDKDLYRFFAVAVVIIIVSVIVKHSFLMDTILMNRHECYMRTHRRICVFECGFDFFFASIILFDPFFRIFFLFSFSTFFRLSYTNHMSEEKKSLSSIFYHLFITGENKIHRSIIVC